MKWLSLATIVAAVGSFAVLLISARALPNEVNLQFVAYWGLFFALTGVLGGLMQETTRAVGAADREANRAAQLAAENRADSVATATEQTAQRIITARPMIVALGVAGATFVILAITGPLWAPLVVDTNRILAIFLMALGLGLYAMQAATSGVLSGRKLWGPYAALIMIDILTRMALAFVAWYFHWGLWAWLVITIFGTFSWLLLAAVNADTRAALTARADVPTRRFTPLMFAAMIASGASALLVTGFPTIIKIAGSTVTDGSGVATVLPADQPSSLGALVTIAGIAYAVTLTRAPLLMPLEKFQNAIIVHFVHNRSAGPIAALAKPLGALVAFGVVGAGLAWAIGPWILGIILDPSYAVSGPVLAGLTLGATLSAVLMITGSVTLAVEKHAMYLVGWLTATVVACGILFIPGHLSLRTIAAISVGSALGIVIHFLALRSVTPTEAAIAMEQAEADTTASDSPESEATTR